MYLILDGSHGYPAVYGPFSDTMAAKQAAIFYFEARDRALGFEPADTLMSTDEYVSSTADGYECTAHFVKHFHINPTTSLVWPPPGHPQGHPWVTDLRNGLIELDGLIDNVPDDDLGESLMPIRQLLRRLEPILAGGE